LDHAEGLTLSITLVILFTLAIGIIVFLAIKQNSSILFP